MEKVKAGDKVVIRASTWNAFIDAANFTKEQRQNQLGKGLKSGLTTGIVLVKNAEGEQRAGGVDGTFLPCRLPVEAEVETVIEQGYACGVAIYAVDTYRTFTCGVA